MRNKLMKSVCAVGLIAILAMPMQPFGNNSINKVLGETEYNFREKVLFPEGLLMVHESYGNQNKLYISMLDAKTLALKWQDDFVTFTGGGCVTGLFNRYCMKNKTIFAYDTKDYFVKCVDITNGKVLWRTGYKQKSDSDDEWKPPIGISTKGPYFYARSNKSLLVFDGKTGEMINRFKCDNIQSDSNVIEISEGLIYCQTKDNYEIINALTGRILYRLKVPKSATYENKGAYNYTDLYVDKEGFGYIRNAKDMPCKFEVKTGKILWTSKKAIVANYAYEDKSNVYLYATNHDMKKPGAKIVSIRKSDGKINWEINTAFTILDLQSSMVNISPDFGKPEQEPVPMCPGTSFQINFLGDKVIVGLGSENRVSKSNIGFQVFRLSDGKEIVRKPIAFDVSNCLLLPDNVDILGLKIKAGETYDKHRFCFMILDVRTGKERELTQYYKWDYGCPYIYDNGYLSFIANDNVKECFTVFDITSGKTVWTLPDKDKDRDRIFKVNGKIVITGGGLIDTFDLKTGKFEKRIKIQS